MSKRDQENLNQGKFKRGHFVWFRGTACKRTGKMLSACEDGPDWFMAMVTTEIMGLDIYSLVWHDGRHVGLPMAGKHLTFAGWHVGLGAPAGRR